MPKMTPQQRPPRVQFYLGSDEAIQAMNELKAYYSTSSLATAALRAMIDHAKSLREPPVKQPVPITYSRRVF